jgi:hypothetical protein
LGVKVLVDFGERGTERQPRHKIAVAGLGAARFRHRNFATQLLVCAENR